MVLTSSPQGKRGKRASMAIAHYRHWLARVREQGHHMHLIPEVLALRRMRAGSLTYSRTPERDSAYLFAARRAILRRRTSAPK